MSDEPLGDRLNCVVSFGCTCIGVPVLVLGITALHTVCDVWGDEKYFSTWSLLDSTLVCCNASCPMLVKLDTCGWVGHNTSGEYGDDCIVGHEPPFKWCWSDKRCELGNYNNVGLAIVLISFGALFLAGSVGLAITGICPNVPIIVRRLLARRDVNTQLKTLRSRATTWLLVAHQPGTLVHLPMELSLLVLEYSMNGPFDRTPPSPIASSLGLPDPDAISLDHSLLPMPWRDPAMSKLIENIVQYLRDGTPGVFQGSVTGNMALRDCEGEAVMEFTGRGLEPVPLQDVTSVMLRHPHMVDIHQTGGEVVVVGLGETDWEAWSVMLKCLGVDVSWRERYVAQEDVHGLSIEDREAVEVAHIEPSVLRQVMMLISSFAMPFTEHQVRQSGIHDLDIMSTSELLQLLVSRNTLTTISQTRCGKSWTTYAYAASLLSHGFRLDTHESSLVTECEDEDEDEEYADETTHLLACN